MTAGISKEYLLLLLRISKFLREKNGKCLFSNTHELKKYFGNMFSIDIKGFDIQWMGTDIIISRAVTICKCIYAKETSASSVHMRA